MADRWIACAALIIAREKANIDITWLKDDSLEDLDNLPSPDVIAREIVEDLTAALRSSKPSLPRSRPSLPSEQSEGSDLRQLIMGLLQRGTPVDG